MYGDVFSGVTIGNAYETRAGRFGKIRRVSFRPRETRGREFVAITEPPRTKTRRSGLPSRTGVPSPYYHRQCPRARNPSGTRVAGVLLINRTKRNPSRPGRMANTNVRVRVALRSTNYRTDRTTEFTRPPNRPRRRFVRFVSLNNSAVRVRHVSVEIEAPSPTTGIVRIGTQYDIVRNRRPPRFETNLPRRHADRLRSPFFLSFAVRRAAFTFRKT